MLIPVATLERIARGEITAALRRWKRATVKPGRTLVTRVGVLAIDAVDVIDAISEQDAHDAGFATIADAEASVAGREGVLTRVRLHYAGPDPRVALRTKLPGDAELAELRDTLDRLDRVTPWTRATLHAIATQEGRSARDLAPELGFERKPWKARVRKLKELGLTESLKTGYRLSPRGRALYDWLQER